MNQMKLILEEHHGRALTREELLAQVLQQPSEHTCLESTAKQICHFEYLPRSLDPHDQSWLRRNHSV